MCFYELKKVKRTTTVIMIQQLRRSESLYQDEYPGTASTASSSSRRNNNNKWRCCYRRRKNLRLMLLICVVSAWNAAIVYDAVVLLPKVVAFAPIVDPTRRIVLRSEDAATTTTSNSIKRNTISIRRCSSEMIQNARNRLFSSSGPGGPQWTQQQDDNNNDDGNDDDNNGSKRKKMKAKFDNLFAGMPSVGEILGGSSGDSSGSSSSSSNGGGESGETPQRTSDSTLEAARRRRQDRQDYTWFEEEETQIMGNYQKILQDMLAELDEQRREDPESVPENAEAMVKSVLKEEMDTEIEATRDRRAQERIQTYEQQRRSEADSKDITGPPNETVQSLIDESEEEYKKWESSRAQIDEFMRYEEEAFRKATEEPHNVEIPKSGSNLDEWALERLEAMAGSRQDVEGEEAILDILEDNVSDLRQRMEKEAKMKGSLEPETMKEWQMYRAIATRIALDDPSTESEKEENREAVEQRILEQLDSWKDYIEKETNNRKESGLARGPHLPFAWQESDLDKPKTAPKEDKRSRSEVRKDINRMSIEALESLMETSDPQRRESLQKEVDYLKSALESRDYLDIDEVEEVEDETGPVDLSDVFQTTTDDDAPIEKYQGVAEPDTFQQPSAAVQPPSTPFFSDSDETTMSPPPPPNSPFFSEDSVEDISKPPPPNSPFFNDEGDEPETVTVAAEDSKLGGMEEQKLQSMYRKKGIRSDEEQARIRDEYEEFQRLEAEKRKQSGLSSDDKEEVSGDIEGRDLKYNVSEVLTEDGDIDAEKVLATIGPRPTRSKKDPTTKDVPEGKGSTESVDSKPTRPGDDSLKSSIKDEEVRDSLYRAVSAVGGGRYKDNPDAKAEQQSSFEEFLRKEDEMRQSLDSLDEEMEAGDKGLVESDADFDDVEYAEEAISSLGPRPQPKRSRIVDEGEFSDKGGILASEYDVDDEDMGDGSVWDSMPEWLRKEKEQDRSESSKGRFPGSEIDEMFDDDQYDKNMRQLHEYEQRRAGKQRQMGIDISDVLGRRAYDTDDYADYKYDTDSFRDRQSRGWGDASFISRKRNLLEYTELEMRELNSLMDLKDSPYSTGVSQYLPRINKPFKEFGAIFRLEGVLIDITGLQFRAWTKVAEQFDFKPPEIEDVQRASVIRPEVAVKDAFFWTDDFLLCREMAVAHREVFRDVFDAWMDEMGLERPAAPATGVGGGSGGSLALGEEVIEGERSKSTPDSEPSGVEQEPNNAMNRQLKAWTVLAKVYHKPMPSQDELFHAASLSADTAIRAAFSWADDPAEVEQIVESYNHYMQTGSLSEGSRTEKSTVDTSEQQSTQATQPIVDGSTQRQAPDESAIMEMYYYAWKKVAERYNFEPPEPEEAMAAFVINDPEIAVRDGFGWTDDPQITKEAVKTFKASLSELINQNSNVEIPVTESLEEKQALAPDQPPKAESSGPSPEELLELQVNAWAKAAQSNGFPPPAADVVLLAQKVDSAEAINHLFRWTDDRDTIDRIATTYEEVLKEESQNIMKKYGLKAEAAPAPKRVERQIGPSQDEIFRAVFDAWVAVARKSDLPEPDIDQVQFALSVGPEEAIITGFEWADEASEVQNLVELYRSEIGIRRQQWSSSPQYESASETEQEVPPFRATPYASDWVKSLLDVEMKCCVVSYLERYQVDVLLDLAGLSDLFSKDYRVSASDGYGEDNQQLLGAALRCDRRPDHCVAFDTSPYSSIAAHEVDMQSVNIIGVYPRYELLAADTTASSCSELTAMNIRRLFSERVYDQPQLETQQALPVTQKIAKTQFWDEE